MERDSDPLGKPEPGITRSLLLITLLTPGVALPIPIDQRASCLAFAHEKGVATKFRDTCSTSYSVLGVDLPGIHPLKVITPIADSGPRPENGYVVVRAVDDRNPDLSPRALLYLDGHINLVVTIEVSVQIKGVHAIGELVFLSERFVCDGFTDHLGNVW